MDPANGREAMKDYLLKPFSDERFEAAMDRAIRFARAGDAETLMSQMRAMLNMPGHTPLFSDGERQGAAAEPRRPLWTAS
jgi:hypothetical protein